MDTTLTLSPAEKQPFYDPKEIRVLRVRADLTQDELARQIGVARFSIIKAERGEAGVKMLQRIADYFGVPLSHLIR